MPEGVTSMARAAVQRDNKGPRILPGRVGHECTVASAGFSTVRLVNDAAPFKVGPVCLR